MGGVQDRALLRIVPGLLGQQGMGPAGDASEVVDDFGDPSGCGVEIATRRLDLLDVDLSFQGAAKLVGRFPELPQGPADGPTDLRQSPGAEQEKRQNEDEDDLGAAQGSEHGSSPPRSDDSTWPFADYFAPLRGSSPAAVRSKQYCGRRRIKL